MVEIYSDCLRSFFMFIVFFPPPILERIALSDYIIKVLQISICILLIIFFFFKKTNILKNMEVVLLAFLLYTFVFCLLISPNRIYNYLAEMGIRILGTLLVCKFISLNENKSTYEYINNYFALLIWLNGLAMILCPFGLIVSSDQATAERANWIFGSKNNVCVMFVTIFVFMFINYRGRIIQILTIILAMVEAISTGSQKTEFFAGSTTAFVVLSLMLIILFLNHFSLVKKIFSRIPTLWISIIGIIEWIIIWSIGFGILRVNEGIFARLGKSNTFSGRSIIWVNSLKHILDSPVFGNGYTEFIFNPLRNVYTSNIYSFWGNILIKFGIVGIIIMIIIMKLSDNDDNVYIESNWDLSIKSIIKIGLLIYMLEGSINGIKWQYMILLLELLTNYKEIFNDHHYDQKCQAVQ